MADNFLRISKGLSLIGQPITPTTLTDGDIWYDSVTHAFMSRANGITGGLGGSPTGTPFSTAVFNGSGTLTSSFQLRADDGLIAIDMTTGGPSNRKLIDDQPILSLDWLSRTLNENTSGATTLNWQSQVLLALSGVPSIEWQAYRARSPANNAILDWGLQRLYYNDGVPTISVDWVNSFLYDTFGVQSVNWDTSRRLWDGVGNDSIQWDNRNMFDENGTTSIIWGSASGDPSLGTRQLWSASGGAGVSIDWDTRILYSAGGLFARVAWDDSVLYRDDGATESISWSIGQLNHNDGSSSLNWDARQTFDSGGNTTIDWGNYWLIGDNTEKRIDWNAWELYGPGNIITVDWSALQTFDLTIGNNLAIDWGVRKAYDSSGTAFTIDWQNGILSDTVFTSVNWFGNYLNDNSGVLSVDWRNRLLEDSGDVPSVDWDNHLLYHSDGSSPFVSIDWRQRYLYGFDGTTVRVDWDGGALYDEAHFTSVDWGGRTLRDSADHATVGWDSRILYGTSTLSAINWLNRTLDNIDGNPVVEWGDKALRVIPVTTSLKSGFTAAQGMIVADSDRGDLEWYNGTAWLTLAAWNTVVKTTTYTAVSYDEIIADSSGGAFTITLPNPVVGSRVRFVDYNNSWGTNNITVARNSHNINGSAADFTLNISGAWAEFIYVDSPQGWKVIS